MLFFDKIKNVISDMINTNEEKSHHNNISNTRKKQVNKKTFKYFKNYYNEYMNSCGLKFKELQFALENNMCINCGCILDAEIKGTKNCPHCKKKIYVRTDFVNKIKIELSEDIIDEFERYDKKMKEISYMEKLMASNEYMCPQYLKEFSKFNKHGLSCRDVIWGYSNYVNNELDNLGYKQFMYASKLKDTDRVLKNFDAIHNFELSNQQLVQMFLVAEYEGKNEISLNLLCDIVYRDIQIVELDKEGDAFRKFYEDDYVNKVHSSLVINFLNKINLNVEDFKKVFLENRHPFIISRLTNDQCWKYIYAALKRQIDWNNKKTN